MAIRVLIIDDSSFARQVLKDILIRNGFAVIGEAKDGLEGIEAVKALNPDVVTLDITMPRMDGLQFLHRIMREHPVPVLIVSIWAHESAPLTVQCLEAGAVDFIPKLSIRGDDLKHQEAELVTKLRAAASARLPAPHGTQWPCPALRRPVSRDNQWVVALGASTGGPRNVVEMLTRLPADFPAPIIYVQHMPAGFIQSYAGRINLLGPLRCKLAEDGDELLPGVIYVAPGNTHLKVAAPQCHDDLPRVALCTEPADTLFRPSVDVMMCSVVDVYGPRTIGVLMTGMGKDGAEGMRAIRDAGGWTIAESEETAVIWGMPQAAIQAGAACEVLGCTEIADRLVQRISQ